MNRNALRIASAAASLVALAGAGANAGTFKTINIDGGVDDWAGVPVLAADAAGDGSPIDYANVQIANDAANLYLRVTYHTAVNPNIGPSSYLAFDTDNNTATGFNIYGLNVVGSEAGFQNDFGFDQRTGYNTGNLNAAASVSPIDFGNPANTFTSQEYSIPRNIAYSSDNALVFGNSFTLMLWTDSSTATDTTAGIAYTFGALSTGWSNGGSGDYNLAANWSSNAVPNSVDAVAEFGTSITSPQTVYSNTAVTVGTISFNNPNQYVIAGAGSLALDVSSGNAAINAQQGSHKINLPLRLNDNTTATVASGATLTIADPLTLANGSVLTKAGAGTMEIISSVTTLSGAATISTTAGNTNLRFAMSGGTALATSGGETRTFTGQRVTSVNVTGGTLGIDSAGAAKVLVTSSLTVSAGKVDVGDNGMIVQGGSASAVRSLISTGRTGGNGIVTTASTTGRAVGYASSTQLGNPTSFMGESFTGPAVLIRYTLLGDTNLTGVVDFDDLVPLAQSYGGNGKEWVNGDFDYDGDVDFDDLVPLAQNYGGSLLTTGELTSLGGADFANDYILAQSLVPEPTTLGAVAGLATLLIRRRR